MEDKGRVAFLDLLINVLKEHENKMDKHLQMAKDIVDLLEKILDRFTFKAVDPWKKGDPLVRVFCLKKNGKAMDEVMDTAKMMKLYKILEKFFGESYPG